MRSAILFTYCLLDVQPFKASLPGLWLYGGLPRTGGPLSKYRLPIFDGPPSILLPNTCPASTQLHVFIAGRHLASAECAQAVLRAVHHCHVSVSPDCTFSKIKTTHVIGSLLPFQEWFVSVPVYLCLPSCTPAVLHEYILAFYNIRPSKFVISKKNS